MLNARQFRRSLARLLGFRPHGVLAGKVHLKHVSVATSEGYFGRPGSSAASFLAEVEAERARPRAETTRRLYVAWQAGETVGGPGRAELEALFAAGRRRGRGAHRGGVRAPPDPGPGPAGSHAARGSPQPLLVRRSLAGRCLQGIQAARSEPGDDQTDDDAPPQPRLGICELTRCANATIHPEHVVFWPGAARDLDRLLATDRLPPHERERLRQERRRLGRVNDSVQKERG